MITQTPASPVQPARLDLRAITTHLTTLAGTHSCPHCDTLAISVITDVTNLLALLARLADQLAASRLENANLRAAMHAALGAADDGEPDPLDYLRWELPSTGRGRR